MIDIRAELDREREGFAPGALYIPRTVLEWRLDPESPWRNPRLGDLDQRIILICDHGCSSILAAATLIDLGFAHAGDVIGGFAGWRDAGLPVCRACGSASGPQVDARTVQRRKEGMSSFVGEDGDRHPRSERDR